MKKSDMFPPKWISAATFGTEPRVFTCECVRREKFEQPDGSTVEKPVLFFRGERSGYVLGPMKWDQVATALDEEDSDQWPDRRIELYPDTTFFAGKRVATVSARKPTGSEPATKKTKKAAGVTKPPFNDEVGL